MSTPDSWRNPKTIRATKASNPGWAYFTRSAIEVYVDMPDKRGVVPINVPYRLISLYVQQRVSRPAKRKKKQ